MLSLQHIGVHFGERTLLQDVSINIGPKDRVGLVGPNGAGKSTLLRLITGQQQPDEGTLAKAGFVTIGYLRQEGISASGKTLFNEALSAFENVLELEEELSAAHQSLSLSKDGSSEQKELLELVGELQHKLDDLDPFRMKSKVERVLMGLGFPVSDFARMTDEFSGGWQMRIELAKLLLREPALILLDEPTNHLDLDSLQWLESYLASYNGGVILVSHDRAFLDSLCTRTLSIERSCVVEYAGNYSFYERERIVRMELLEQQFKNQQKSIKETERFIDRFRYKATKARQVQSRIKQLEKIERIELEDEESAIQFRFSPPQSSGRVVIELLDVAKHYGSVEVYRNLSVKIDRGDRIAVVGVNGAGKSTLAKILAGAESFSSGERRVGYNVVLSYFAQHQAEELDLSKEALEVIDEAAEGEIRKKLRTILGSFLFHGDDVFKKVAVLSGGEKSRLALAKMLVQPANFLIMDEPTNHLDMRSKEVLQDALANYDGTYLIVSHDRAFLDPIVNKVLEIGSTGVRWFLGNVSEYIAKKQKETSLLSSRKENAAASARAPEGQQRSKNAEQEKRQQKEIRNMEKEIASIEQRIAELEETKKNLESRLADPDFYKSASDSSATLNRYKETERLLHDAYNQWNMLGERMAELQANHQRRKELHSQ